MSFKLSLRSAYRRVTSGTFPIAKVASAISSRGLLTTPSLYQDATLLKDIDNGFGFARSNPRPAKPRSKGVTEIRGPYYSVCTMLKYYFNGALKSGSPH
jgi:hypothetical protein